MAIGRAVRRWELWLLLALATWAALQVAVLLRWARGRTCDGGTAMYGSADQLQYMAWIRDASAHVLASNLFQATADRHVFLQPMFTFSGILVRSGVPIQIAFLLWEPVAVVVLLIGVLAYARRLMISPFDQVMSAALGLFYFSPLAAAVHWSGVGSPQDAFGFVPIPIHTFTPHPLCAHAPSPPPIPPLPLSLTA